MSRKPRTSSSQRFFPCCFTNSSTLVAEDHMDPAKKKNNNAKANNTYEHVSTIYQCDTIGDKEAQDAVMMAYGVNLKSDHRITSNSAIIAEEIKLCIDIPSHEQDPRIKEALDGLKG